MNTYLSLWGEDFEVGSSVEENKKAIDSIKQPKKGKSEVQKQLASKKLSIQDKLEIIKKEVHRILGKHIEDTIVIKTKEELKEYFDKAEANGVMGIDTETDNSVDYLNCKIMGLCIYTPGMKQAYVPINHTDLSDKRLEWQLTENDIAEQLSTLKSRNIRTYLSNAKFDYQVIKCTCGGIQIPIGWDTQIAAKLLDENEPKASLKEQYIDKIDNSQEKYSISGLFGSIPYAYVSPEVFALYAATDPYMSYVLGEWQRKQLELPENSKIYKLYQEVELPNCEVFAELEMAGVCIDTEYTKRLEPKYTKQLAKANKEVEEELARLKPTIDSWKSTLEATKKSAKGKSKAEQLTDPINIDSPIQVAILVYDILGATSPDEDSPRGTSKEILEQIDLPICQALCNRKSLIKLTKDFIIALPKNLNKKDNKIHGGFNQYGAKTGRVSSSEPNLQNVPSKASDIRMMFKASIIEHNCQLKDDNYYEVKIGDEVLTSNGWKNIKEIKIGDTICGDDSQDIVSDIQVKDDMYLLFV